MPGLRSGTTFEQNSSIGAVGESCCGMDHHPVSSVSPATTGADGCSTTAELGQPQEGGANEQTRGDDDTLHTEDWLPPVDLTHLTDEQRLVAEKILREESGAFSRDKYDQGDVPDMEMEIHLTDNVPVVVPHRQIPRPLYEEVKNFVNDMVVNNWIRESTSNYSSPMVFARKKGWFLPSVHRLSSSQSENDLR